MKKKGIVYLVGAGPGDSRLITVKGRECLQKADCIIYDALVNPVLLREVKQNVECIYVGKKAAKHTFSQEEINRLLVQKAQENLYVVRLKGGDSILFSRGAEEAEFLKKHNIPFIFVPGVSSAFSVPAYCGIPVTHRENSSQVTIITGHEDPQKESSRIDYDALAKSSGTKIIFMGFSQLSKIISTLQEKGIDMETPIALISQGTLPKQKVLKGKLGTILNLVKNVQMDSPVLTIIGECVKYREDLQWIENLPLHGKCVMVTRTRKQGSEIASLLQDFGAEVEECPLIEILPPQNEDSFVRKMKNISKYEWLIFTSPNGVQYFFETLLNEELDIRSLAKVKIAVVGPATQKALRKYGFLSDLMPQTYQVEALLTEFENQKIEGKKLLWVRPEKANDIFISELEKLGAEVETYIAYRTVPRKIKNSSLEKIDLVIFASSSAVESFFDLFAEIPPSLKFASIGPITTHSLQKKGYVPAIQAKESTIESLLESIIKIDF